MNKTSIPFIMLKHTTSSVEAANQPDHVSQRRLGPAQPRYGIPRSAWPDVIRRIEQGETLREVASRYETSYETVRRVLLRAKKASSNQ